MVNKTTSNDILVKVDQNNLIYIDPNAVLSNGVIQGREVEQENLVMYVNLEADLIPRTTLIAANDKNILTSIAKGTLNFLRNKDGSPLDTSWTDTYNYSAQKKDSTNNPNNLLAQSDLTGQSFGIENIQIHVAGANFVPQISIKFVDVRGKTLFESPANSPYTAFFHLPWPIYYLTIKGYYGKAIKYRLHMTKFNSKYNPTNGNFEIDTTFVGSTYAYLADIPFDGILNAPYLYPIINDYSVESTNTNTKTTVKKMSRTSKGFTTLKSVYQQYIQMGLLPPRFPVKTLREVIIIAKGLEKILEQQIFDTVIDTVLLNGIKEFLDILNNGSSNIIVWGQRNLDFNGFITTTIGVKTFKWYQLNASVVNRPDIITGTTKGTLQQFINNTISEGNNNATFGQNRKGTNVKKNPTLFNVNTIPPISFSSISDISRYVQIKNSRIYVGYDLLLDNYKIIEQKYNEQTDKIRSSIETTMNTVFQNGVGGKDGKEGKGGFGFQPTIRNIIGVVLANADTYIRLLQDVHTNAFNAGETRRRKLSTFSTDSIGNNDIYPWPEVKKKTEGIKQNVLVYPGSSDVATKLGSYDRKLWPEVDFVENFNAIATKKLDPLDNTEGNTSDLTWTFEGSANASNSRNISTLTYLFDAVPYCSKTISSILYEIVERIRYTVSYDTFNPDTLIELSDIEFSNLQYQIQDDNDIIDILKTIDSQTKYISYMKGYSPDRYKNFQDQLSTVPYIKNGLSQNFSFQKYVPGSATTGQYPKLDENLRTYIADDYRVDIYPFSSPRYLSYLKKDAFTKNELNFDGLLKTSDKDGFICSPHESRPIWIKNDFSDKESNIFDNTFFIGGQTKHILNTPYFHRQLYTDFVSEGTTGKYASSAYLFLNSLPFKDLDDSVKRVNGNDVLVSSIFREVGATHFIPYHLMLKWGSIYHRYKKFILEGIDIIDGIWNPIDGDLFFDDYSGRTYVIPSGNTTGYSINRVTKTNIGINPFYYSIFHQITNGYTFFDQTSPGAVTGFTQTILSGGTRTYNLSMAQGGNGYTWTTFIDESKYDTKYSGYTLLPSNGYNIMNTTDYLKSEQENYRILWNIDTAYDDVAGTPIYSGETFNDYDQYFKDINNNYVLSNNNKIILDLIGTFSPDILDEFESAFLDFSSQAVQEEIPYSRYGVEYANFQRLLKEMVYIDKNKSDPTDYSILLDTPSGLKQRQYKKLQEISTRILSDDNLISFTMANPKEINNYILGGFTGVDSKQYVINPFNESQLTQENVNFIQLYLGEETLYQDFFIVNNIELNEENIKSFRFLNYIYAGYVYAGYDNNYVSFRNYLITNILLKTSTTDSSTQGQRERFNTFFKNLVDKLRTLREKTDQQLTVNSGYNDDPIKLELYNFFKSFNDKWIAGNSIGQRTLMEEFLFLDKANRDIGDSVYLDMKKLVDLGAQPNRHSLNLYNVISILISNTGFDMRALPAYVNFYGTNFSNKSKVTPSKTVAKNIFGTFLEVDYQESMPKIILQYIGQNSKQLDLLDIDANAQFKDDSFDIGVVNNNPILVSPNTRLSTDFSKSNKAVAFEVSIGDQNQSIFKGVELDQNTIKNTTESFYVLERLGNSESGSSTAQIDIGLYDVYRQASYSCTVTALGNVMIQPTMFFYLKNIPMFRGSYWITEVSHNITAGGIDTSFKGSRIPMHALPDPKDSFLASYRAMYDSLLAKSALLVKNQTSTSTTVVTETQVGTGDHKNASIDMGKYNIPNEAVIQKIGFMTYGIPFNGQDSIKVNGVNLSKYIQYVTYNGENWLRAVALEMGGVTYKPSDNDSMSFATKFLENQHPIINWSKIKDNKTNMFYSTIFDFNQILPDDIISKYPNTEFLNPNTNPNIPFTVKSEYNYDFNTFDGPVNVGPALSGYGIGLSHALMRKLGLADNQVVYFRLV